MSRSTREIPLAAVDIETGGQHARTCDHPGCTAAGEHRAPRSRENPDVYYWFCLDHVREYNASWDYFQGWSEEKIERFRREAITGHRPTWKLGHAGYRAWAEGRVRDEFGVFGSRFAGGRAEAPPAEQQMDARQRRALAKLDLDDTADLQGIKMRYKQLVKRHHPDANGGDKAAEERFKAINEAYSYLLTCGYT